jgi:rSAM/selenodomain-associated transferase 1
LNQNKYEIIVFEKNPRLGKVKTRLAETIGDHKALEIYQYLLGLTHSVVDLTPFHKAIYYSDFIPNAVEKGNYSFELQQEGDLGNKMSLSFLETFEKGFEKVLIIGTDCPEISPELLYEAFEILEENDAVIGPASDGGYYLLGMKSYHPELFKNMIWSSESVYDMTIEKFKESDLTYGVLEVLNDIDTEEDWNAYLEKSSKEGLSDKF